MTEANAPEYVEARRALLDALEHLGEHRASVIIAGAQAIYLRTGDSPYFAGVQAFTTDADLALDPSTIGDGSSARRRDVGSRIHPPRRR